MDIIFFFSPLFFSSSLNDSIFECEGGEEARLIIDEKKGGINSIHELGPFLHPPCVDHTIDACFNGARIRTLAHISSNHVILKRFPDRSRIRSKCGARLILRSDVRLPGMSGRPDLSRLRIPISDRGQMEGEGRFNRIVIILARRSATSLFSIPQLESIDASIDSIYLFTHPGILFFPRTLSIRRANQADGFSVIRDRNFFYFLGVRRKYSDLPSNDTSIILSHEYDIQERETATR